jgi:hypothetical protein
MGRTRALFEVQRYLTDVGWVAHSPPSGKPIWFRSLETARVDLHTEMLLCVGPAKLGGELRSPRDFDPSAYRITDGITVWKPAWNADKTALSIRVAVERGPAELAGRIEQSSRSMSRWRARATTTVGAPRNLAFPGLNDNGDSDRRHPSTRS